MKVLGDITLCENVTPEAIIPKNMLKHLLGGCGGSGDDDGHCACWPSSGDAKCCTSESDCESVCGADHKGWGCNTDLAKEKNC